MLDDALQDARAASVTSSPDTNRFTYRPAHPFLFAKPPLASSARMAFTHAWPHAPAAAANVRLAPVEPVRPAWTLTPVQQRAIDLLRGSGAQLSSRFSAAELRREYRRLALRIHPDRHHGASVAERERLSREFADVSHSYRRLLAVVEPRH